MSICGQAFSQCTACSETVINAYEDRGKELILDAMNDPKYLEDLTGLTKLHQMTDIIVENWDDDDEFDDDDF